MFDWIWSDRSAILRAAGSEGAATTVLSVWTHRFGRSRIESAPPAARTVEPGPFMARTPARPDGATWEAARLVGRFLCSGPPTDPEATRGSTCAGRPRWDR